MHDSSNKVHLTGHQQATDAGGEITGAGSPASGLRPGQTAVDQLAKLVHVVIPEEALGPGAGGGSQLPKTIRLLKQFLDRRLHPLWPRLS
jgi:hypothetical protein